MISRAVPKVLSREQLHRFSSGEAGYSRVRMTSFLSHNVGSCKAGELLSVSLGLAEPWDLFERKDSWVRNSRVLDHPNGLDTKFIGFNASSGLNHINLGKSWLDDSNGKVSQLDLGKGRVVMTVGGLSRFRSDGLYAAAFHMDLSDLFSDRYQVHGIGEYAIFAASNVLVAGLDGAILPYPDIDLYPKTKCAKAEKLIVDSAYLALDSGNYGLVFK